MNIYKLLFILVLTWGFGFGPPANASYFAGILGARSNLESVTTNNFNSTASSTATTSFPQIGALAIFGFSDTLMLRTGLIYAPTNMTLVENLNGVLFNIVANVSYLNIPLALQIEHQQVCSTPHGYSALGQKRTN